VYIQAAINFFHSFTSWKCVKFMLGVPERGKWLAKWICLWAFRYLAGACWSMLRHEALLGLLLSFPLFELTVECNLYSSVMHTIIITQCHYNAASLVLFGGRPVFLPIESLKNVRKSLYAFSYEEFEYWVGWHLVKGPCKDIISVNQLYIIGIGLNVHCNVV